MKGKAAQEGFQSLTVQPKSPKHQSSIILLHPCGSDGQQFRSYFRDVRDSKGQSLPDIFPNTRFIFPTARLPSTTATRQWFECINVDSLYDVEEVPSEGLHHAAKFLLPIIHEEGNLVGYHNVIIGGLGQGCVTALHILSKLHQSMDPTTHLGGFLGMKCSFPLQDKIKRNLVNRRNMAPDDTIMVFDDMIPRSGDILGLHTPKGSLLGPSFTECRPICVSVPTSGLAISKKEKVVIGLGFFSNSMLAGFGTEYVWIDYERGNWGDFSEQMDEIIRFLRRVVKEVVEEDIPLTVIE